MDDDDATRILCICFAAEDEDDRAAFSSRSARGRAAGEGRGGRDAGSILICCSVRALMLGWAIFALALQSHETWREPTETLVDKLITASEVASGRFVPGRKARGLGLSATTCGMECILSLRQSSAESGRRASYLRF